MFKKRTVKRKPRRREESDEEEEEEDDGAGDRIQMAKKRRQVLEGLQKRGLDATATVTQPQQPQEAKKEKDVDEQKDQTQRETSAILEEKHRQAMEEYIQSKQQKHADTMGQQESEKSTKSVPSTKDLYEELASKVAGAGNVRESEGAVEAGTATVLAEVVLPKQQMAPIVPTAQRPKNKNISSVPALPSRFALDNNYEQLPDEAKELFQKQQPQATMAKETSSAVDEESPTLDSDRIGFQALRHGERHAPRQHQSKDDRVFKKFVTKQREQREKSK